MSTRRAGESLSELRARDAAYMREYRRRKRNGENTSRPPVLERIMAKVTKQPGDGCWLFACTPNNRGYGEVWSRKERREPVHRVVFREMKGEIPEGFVIHHQCRTKLCVNPDHLVALSNAEHSRMEFSRRRMQCPKCGWVEGEE